MVTGKKWFAFNGQFTKGNLATMVVFLLGMGITWGTLVAAVHTNTQAVKANCEKLEVHMHDKDCHYLIGSAPEEKLDAIEDKLNDIDKKVSAIQVQMNGGK